MDAKPRARWWSARSGDEESRAYLQSRLVVLSRLMLWSFASLLLGMFLLYRTYPEIEPVHNDTIYGVAGLGMCILLAIWFGALARRAVTLRWLYAIDAFYGASTGTIFASASVIASDLEMAAIANMLWSCFIVFLRTIVVPSTGSRTIVVATCTLLPMLVAASVIAANGEQELLPPGAYVGSVVVVNTVVTLLATVGSRLIYGLRKQVTAAMRLGQYTLEGRIGEGGNGAVYRAHHALLRRPTAIKLIRPDRIDADTLDRFEREVQHMSLLSHANTVAVFDYGRSPDGIFYYAMEYLDGIDLEKLVARHGPQPQDRVVSILLQVCGALAEAHRRGIIHRDIKPANIILCERGDVPDVAKVVDFGLVKEIASAHGDSTRAILGTPLYVAPEVVTEPGGVGPAADLYALGAVGYFLLAGRPVFDGKNSVELCVKHVTATPRPLSEVCDRPVDPALEALLLSCLSKQPDARPASAAELARALRAIPPQGDWTEDAALRWWSEFSRADQLASASQAMTITIDLGSREHEPARVGGALAVGSLVTETGARGLSDAED